LSVDFSSALKDFDVQAILTSRGVFWSYADSNSCTPSLELPQSEKDDAHCYPLEINQTLDDISGLQHIQISTQITLDTEDDELAPQSMPWGLGQAAQCQEELLNEIVKTSEISSVPLHEAKVADIALALNKQLTSLESIEDVKVAKLQEQLELDPIHQGMVLQKQMEYAAEGLHEIIEPDCEPREVQKQVKANRPLFRMLGEEICCCSDVVAVVVAQERESAQQAASMMDMVIEQGEPHFDVEYASQRHSGREVIARKFKRGDVSAAFSKAASVVSGTWYLSIVDVPTLELPSCLAEPRPDGTLCIYCNTADREQAYAAIENAITGIHRLEIISLPGSRGEHHRPPLIEPYAAQLAVKLQKPVKLTLNRRDAVVLLPKRHACRIHLSLSCDSKGNLSGIRLELLADTGGYHGHALEFLLRALAHACGPYRVPNYEISGRMLSSNQPDAGMMFAEGVVQVCFALEGAIDMLAEHIGMDQWAIRYRNLLKPGELLPSGQSMPNDYVGHKSLEAIRQLYHKYGEHAGLACSIMGYNPIIPTENRDNYAKDADTHPCLPHYANYACAAQLAVLHPEERRVRRLITACDVGRPLYLPRAISQIEGMLHAGLDYTLFSNCPTIEGMPQYNYLKHHDSLNIDNMPHLQTILIAEQDEISKQSSERTLCPEVAFVGVAPAIAAAFALYSKTRYYHLPITPHDTE
jgi:CO/xanthine dehydrogenase Mo-binding subunit